MQDIKSRPKRRVEIKTKNLAKPQKKTVTKQAADFIAPNNRLAFTPEPEYVPQQLADRELKTIEQLWSELDHGEENELKVLSQKISENGKKLKQNLTTSLQMGLEENTRRIKDARQNFSELLDQPVSQAISGISQKTKNLQQNFSSKLVARKIEKKTWAENYLRNSHHFYARWYAFKKNKYVWRAAVLAVLAVMIIASLQGAVIYAQTQSAKLAVMNSANLGVADLKNAAQLAQQKNLIGAQQQLEEAQQNFSQAKTVLAGLGVFLNSFTSQGQASNDLLDAGERASMAAQDLSQFYALATQIKISPAGLSSPDGFYQTANAAENFLQKAIDDLSQANKDLGSVDPSVLPGNIKPKFGQYKDNLSQALSSLQQVHSLITLFQQFIGPGPKNILVLFENNRELRPTGGFIGTYGYFRMNDGVISSQKISSVYDLDGQLAEKIAPPGQFHDLTDHWGLRDSNWFPDFSQSAQKAISFYEMEGMETPDAVIAMTPDVFVDLLGLTGPINFPKYNVTLTADNFRDVVQVQTSQDYNKAANTPKQMLADFMPLFMQKLSGLKGQDRTQAIADLLANFEAKNILIYDRNPEIESAFQNYNWTGTIAKTNGDYLAVYNANLGGKKTDLDVSQKLSLSSSVDSSGGIVNTLTYTRTQGQTDIDPNTPNIDYVRFLVPKGSALISASGFTKRPHYSSDGSGYANSPGNFTIDPDLQKIDASTTIDDSSGTAISEESGKTVFGNWIETAPGQTATIVLKYKLPFNLSDNPAYSLVVQKQPGDNDVDFSYISNIGKQLLWYTPDNLNISAGSVQYTAKLKSDIFIGAVFAR